MNIEIFADADAAAIRAAQLLGIWARAAVAGRGRFSLAVSGGSTPAPMLRALALQAVPWEAVQLFQVDERVAPAGHRDRNLTQLRGCLLQAITLPPANLHVMPVERQDLEAAAAEQARALASVTGSPAVLDAVQLGLGTDGHTASLVPGDPVLGVTDRDIAVTDTYAGHRRMTLTYPALDRARQILWLVTGSQKASVLPRLLAGDRSLPAGRVRHQQAVLIADAAAAAGLR